MFFKKLDNKCEIIKNDSELEKQIKALEYQLERDKNATDKKIHEQALKDLKEALK